jgi:hypothetical protein
VGSTSHALVHQLFSSGLASLCVASVAASDESFRHACAAWRTVSNRPNRVEVTSQCSETEAGEEEIEFQIKWSANSLRLGELTLRVDVRSASTWNMAG